MNNLDEIIARFNESDYWDENIVQINCYNLADSLHIVLEHAEYTFLKCYKIDFTHDMSYTKQGYIKYYLQNIIVEIADNEGIPMYKTTLSAWPMTLNVISKDINIIITE